MSNEKHNVTDQEFVDQIRKTLDDSVERIDADTRHKLIAARQQALVQHQNKTWFSASWTKATFATAFSIVLAIVVVKTQLTETLELDENEAIDLVVATDTIDLFEDLEFYTWLAEHDAAT